MIVGYARVSTTGQNLDGQLEQLTAVGCEKIFKEKASGADSQRPELASMLDYVREGDQVVVAKLDRIARSTKNFLEIVEALEGKGVPFKVLNLNLDTSTSTGKLMLSMLSMLSMLGAIAQFERELMLERQAEGIARGKAAGKYQGRKPTARKRSPEVIELAGKGVTKDDIADRLGISRASVYRILAAAKD